MRKQRERYLAEALMRQHRDSAYVPVPAAFFDALPQMSDAEMRVSLALCQLTAGPRPVMSWAIVPQIAALTKMKPAAILRGIADARRRGILSIESEARPGRGGTTYAYRAAILTSPSVPASGGVQ